MNANTQVKREKRTSVKSVMHRMRWGNILKAALVTTAVGLGIAVIKIVPSRISAPFDDPAVQMTYKASALSTNEDTVDYEYKAFVEDKRAKQKDAELRANAEIIAESKFTSYKLQVGVMTDSFDIVEIQAPEEYYGKTVAIYNATDDAGLGKYVGSYKCTTVNPDGIVVVAHDADTCKQLDKLMDDYIYIKLDK